MFVWALIFTLWLLNIAMVALSIFDGQWLSAAICGFFAAALTAALFEV